MNLAPILHVTMVILLCEKDASSVLEEIGQTKYRSPDQFDYVYKDGKKTDNAPKITKSAFMCLEEHLVPLFTVRLHDYFGAFFSTGWQEPSRRKRGVLLLLLVFALRSQGF